MTDASRVQLRGGGYDGKYQMDRPSDYGRMVYGLRMRPGGSRSWTLPRGGMLTPVIKLVPSFLYS